MKIQQSIRSDLISGSGKHDFMLERDIYVNKMLKELNSRGFTVLRIDDEPTRRDPFGNMYGYIHFFVEADSDDPVYQKALNQASTSTSSSTNSSGGCYIATCVYGSYDCPQVWVLRRYRDTELAYTWYGRTFIRLYYAISPKIVKWFGHTEWFRRIWKQRLDIFIAKLKNSGIMDTPYDDKSW